MKRVQSFVFGSSSAGGRGRREPRCGYAGSYCVAAARACQCQCQLLMLSRSRGHLPGWANWGGRTPAPSGIMHWHCLKGRARSRDVAEVSGESPGHHHRFSQPHRGVEAAGCGILLCCVPGNFLRLQPVPDVGDVLSDGDRGILLHWHSMRAGVPYVGSVMEEVQRTRRKKKRVGCFPASSSHHPPPHTGTHTRPHCTCLLVAALVSRVSTKAGSHDVGNMLSRDVGVSASGQHGGGKPRSTGSLRFVGLCVCGPVAKFRARNRAVRPSCSNDYAHLTNGVVEPVVVPHFEANVAVAGAR